MFMSTLERTRVSPPQKTHDQVVGRVYLITNLVNGKKYVGQTICSLSTRWRQHKHSAKTGSTYAIHSAIRKYGEENFTVTCIETVCGLRNDLISAERRCIGSAQSQSPLGYNMTGGGDGVDFTPDVRAKHLAAVQNRSEEWKENIMKAAKARSADPIWLANTSSRLERMRSTTGWGDKVVVWAAVAREAGRDKTSAKDALRTPEDLARILKRRAAVRDSATRMKDPNHVHLSQAEKDALLSSEELAKRLTHRERVQRSRAKKVLHA